MRNVIIIKKPLAAEPKALAAASTVATFTVTASPKNTVDVSLSDGKGNEIPMAPGAQYRFERVDLLHVLVGGKAGENVFVVGYST